MMKSHIIRSFVMNNEPDINLSLNNDKSFMQNNIWQIKIKDSLMSDSLFYNLHVCASVYECQIYLISISAILHQ